MARRVLDGRPPMVASATQREVGAYRLLERLGAGGMGEVWIAEHTLLGRRAAVKLLHPAMSAREDIVTRFFNEARAAASIADPGIVQVFDFGRTADGTTYIAMELLAGETLDARARRLGALAVVDALRLVRQVAASLGAAHARGIVHRDLKPENIFIAVDAEVAGGERAKLLDFGIAKLADSAHRTQTSALMGTPAFMSPEQCRGAGHVDARSDVYSLGCVLFAILAGAPPFVAEGMGELLMKHMAEAPPRLASRAAVPAELDELVARCLAKDPAVRPASGAALAAELSALIERLPEGTGASRSMPIARSTLAPATTLSTAASSFAPSSSSSPRRRRSVAIAAIGSVAVVAVVIAVAAAGARGGGAPATAPAMSARVDAAVATVAVDAPVPPVSIDAAAPVDAGIPPVADAAIDAPVAVPAPAPRPRRGTPASPVVVRPAVADTPPAPDRPPSLVPDEPAPTVPDKPAPPKPVERCPLDPRGIPVCR